jgi:hypothetical protein
MPATKAKTPTVAVGKSPCRFVPSDYVAQTTTAKNAKRYPLANPLASSPLEEIAMAAPLNPSVAATNSFIVNRSPFF